MYGYTYIGKELSYVNVSNVSQLNLRLNVSVFTAW